MAGFARWVPQQIGTRKDILVAMDWTDFDRDGQATLVLSLVTGGLFFYVLGVVLLFVLLGLIHNALWGAAMSQQVAGEREEMELLEKAKEPPASSWTYRR